ncbi:MULTISPECIES: dihydrodipicolinate synthase family protein [Streptomyces]|uniref:4-hydroxy-tetrahydrodipicolinate synthase n=1 Tax=Streptomyces lycii TaxID=2654337 RepID=A0ABQ7FP12_9ACTN|nr:MULTISPECIES: dihydrodipicolinate synthase family protein [Streptomyces]KAF4410135.1 4-hydroxy-tetrahydrodipicolinate synthase [Streptomyces lycii]PGH50047.1 4-hydroxy-tetrahydrodipicolinate synthase [Streptomyces sp. Ru87]
MEETTGPRPLRGIHVPLVTPFDTGGRIAYEALEGLAHTALDEGAAGLVALGTTAEAAALDPGEQGAVTDLCARVCRERGATLIVGAGTNDTRTSAARLRELGERHPDATALVPVPYYTRPSEEGVVAHFAELARHSPVPLVVYNIPYRTARVLSGETLLRLGALPGVAGVKHAVGGIDQDTLHLLGGCHPDFAVLAGDDAFAAPLLALGAAGGVLAVANLCAGRFAELAALWRGGDADRARPLGHALTALARAAFAEPNPTVLKGVLHRLGRIPSPAVRLPLLPASGDAVARTLTRLEPLAR